MGGTGVGPNETALVGRCSWPSCCGHGVLCLARVVSRSPGCATRPPRREPPPAQSRRRLRGPMSQAGQHAGVGVSGEHDAGVPEHRLHDLQVVARGQGQARRAVPQVVQPDQRQSRLRSQPGEGVRYIPRAQRPAVPVGEQEPDRFPGVLAPLRSKCPQRRHQAMMGGHTTVRPPRSWTWTWTWCDT
jgi:hypothetical protein